MIRTCKNDGFGSQRDGKPMEQSGSRLGSEVIRATCHLTRTSSCEKQAYELQATVNISGKPK